MLGRTKWMNLKLISTPTEYWSIFYCHQQYYNEWWDGNKWQKITKIRPNIEWCAMFWLITFLNVLLNLRKWTTLHSTRSFILFFFTIWLILWATVWLNHLLVMYVVSPYAHTKLDIYNSFETIQELVSHVTISGLCDFYQKGAAK